MLDSYADVFTSRSNTIYDKALTAVTVKSGEYPDSDTL